MINGWDFDPRSHKHDQWLRIFEALLSHKTNTSPARNYPINSSSKQERSNGKEDLGLNVGGEEGYVEEDEEDELYRDVNINQGRGIDQKDLIRNLVMMIAQPPIAKMKNTPWSYQNQKAFVRGFWSDNEEDEEEKTKDEKCLMAKASNGDDE
nr:hypothetical protein [Tanacetum cinerariifolium]